MREFLVGTRYFARGVGWVARRPRQWLFGLIPALIVLAGYIVGLIFLVLYAADLARAVSPFAGHWSPGARDAARTLIAISLVGAGLAIAIVAFTAVTLVVGSPFYESLAERVEEAAGGAPAEVRQSWWRQLVSAVGDGLVVGLITTLFGAAFFLLGFLPVVGQTVVPVIAACVSGHFLTLELTSIALERRGLRRRARFALLRANRALSVGFGVSVFVAFLVPLGAVLMMPGAVAGGTLLARERLAGQGIAAGETAVSGGAAPAGGRGGSRAG